MECGLREAALTAPEVALTDQEALAEDAGGDAPGELAFVELCLLHHEDLIDQVGAVDERAFLHHHVETDHVAVFARHLLHARERILAQRERHAEDGRTLWSRRIVFAVSRHFRDSAA